MVGENEPGGSNEVHHF